MWGNNYPNPKPVTRQTFPSERIRNQAEHLRIPGWLRSSIHPRLTWKCSLNVLDKRSLLYLWNGSACSAPRANLGPRIKRQAGRGWSRVVFENANTRGRLSPSQPKVPTLSLTNPKLPHKPWQGSNSTAAEKGWAGSRCQLWDGSTNLKDVTTFLFPMLFRQSFWS